MSTENQGEKPRREVTIMVEKDGKKEEQKFNVTVHKCKDCRKEVFWRIEGKKKDGSDKWVAHTFEKDYPSHNHFGERSKHKERKIVCIYPVMPGSMDNTIIEQVIGQYKKDFPDRELTSMEVRFESSNNCWQPIYYFTEYVK